MRFCSEPVQPAFSWPKRVWSSNPKKGTGFYTNKGVINSAKGGLQLVPPSFGNGYEAKLYHTASSTETLIPLLDARDWNLDYFNGIVFQQDPPGTGFHAQNPTYVDAFIYIGDYVGSMLGNSGAGDQGATYIVLSNTGSLSGERALVAGTGLTLIDGGAGSSATLSVNDGIVATLTGSVFTGQVKFENGLVGSLTELPDGTPYLRGADNIQITTSSDGYVTIAAPDLTIDGFDRDAQFLVLGATGSMKNERVFTAGSGINVDDGGAGNAFSVSVDDNIVATISGSTFTGPVKFNQGLSGSLTRIESGLSYLVAGSNVTIASSSNGQVTISSPTPSDAIDTDLRTGPFVTFEQSSHMSNERVLTAGPGITLSTSEAGFLTIQADALGLTRTKKYYDIESTLTRLNNFQTTGMNYGEVGYSPDAIDIHVNGMLVQSGTLSQVTNGTADYTLTDLDKLQFGFDLQADDVVAAVMVASGSSGEAGGGAPVSSPYVTFGASGQLSNERVITGGRGVEIDNSVANQVLLHSNRQKVNFSITAPQAAGSSLAIPGVDFSLGSHADKHIDIFINGVLMTSGSAEDYVLTGDTNGVTVNFALTYDDKITVLIQ